MWLDLTASHRQTWLFGSTSTYHSTDLLTARGVAHLVVHGTSGSTSYETIPHVRLETSGDVLSTVDMVCNDATALAGYANMMMMMMIQTGYRVVISRPRTGKSTAIEFIGEESVPKIIINNTINLLF